MYRRILVQRFEHSRHLLVRVDGAGRAAELDALGLTGADCACGDDFCPGRPQREVPQDPPQANCAGWPPGEAYLGHQSSKREAAVTIQAVVFDIGETLLDDSREFGAWADWLGVPRHTFSAVLGASTAEGRDNAETFQHLRPGFNVTAHRPRPV